MSISKNCKMCTRTVPLPAGYGCVNRSLALALCSGSHFSILLTKLTTLLSRSIRERGPILEALQGLNSIHVEELTCKAALSGGKVF